MTNFKGIWLEARFYMEKKEERTGGALRDSLRNKKVVLDGAGFVLYCIQFIKVYLFYYACSL